MMTVLMLRHGETELNRRGALRGQIDVPLSPVGEREAARLARRIRDQYPLTALYSSPLARARATAEAIATATGVGVEVDHPFTDLDYGAWAGRTVETFSAAERDRFLQWQRQPDVALPGAEDPRTIQKRAFDRLVERTRPSHGCVAIVTHDAILQLLLCRILGIDLPSYRGIVQHTAALNELHRRGETWRVHLVNSTWHLDDSI